MADLSDYGRKAMIYWPQIEYAAREGLTTADMWDSIRDAAEEYGYEAPGASARGVSELRGLAGRIAASGRKFEASSHDLTIQPDMLGEAPWSRSLPEQAALSIHQVRYQHTFIQDGEAQTEWRTSVFTGQLPATVGELRDAIQQDANELANKYGTGHVDFGNVQILRV